MSEYEHGTEREFCLETMGARLYVSILLREKAYVLQSNGQCVNWH